MVNIYPSRLKYRGLVCKHSYLTFNSFMSPALIRMGDLLYEGHDDRQKDLFSAAEMYTQAALRNEPQVCFF